MSIDFTTPNPQNWVLYGDAGTIGTSNIIGAFSFTYDPANAIISEEVTEVASDGTMNTLITGIWNDTLSYSGGAGIDSYQIQIPSSFYSSHIGGTVTYNVNLYEYEISGGEAVQIDLETFDVTVKILASPPAPTAQTIQNDYLAITGMPLSLAAATTELNAINAGTTTETAYVDSLLLQVANTTIPAVAVEASMYGVTGTSAEITSLVTNFLPGQLAYASQAGLDPVVFACLETALVFAFSNETGATTFANNYGPSNAAMPATAAGDAAFAAAATNAIFGSAQTANTAPAILGYVTWLEGFFTANGIVGVQNPTADQIDLAARAGAWGEGVAIALENNLGALPGQVTNFLEDAAQGTAIYSASLSSQPTAAPFQGAATASVTTTASSIQVTGIAAHVDHIVM